MSIVFPRGGFPEKVFQWSLFEFVRYHLLIIVPLLPLSMLAGLYRVGAVALTFVSSVDFSDPCA